MDRAIELPPGKWEMSVYDNTVYLVSPDHPPILIDGGEAKVLDMSEASAVFLAYDSRSPALSDLGKKEME